MTKVENALEHVNDAMDALRETPMRPRDAFNILKYCVTSVFKHPDGDLEAATRKNLEDGLEMLRHNRPREATEKVRPAQDALLIKVTRLRQSHSA